MRFIRGKTLTVVLVVVVFAAILSAGAAWHFSSPERTCGSCHEIQPAQELWSQSAHREVACADCHGSALSNGLHSLFENGRRVNTHFAEDRPESILLKEEQVMEMTGRCKECHEREYAAWLASGHSLTYADVFLNEKHNLTEQINEDCLRCHAMFFEGKVHDIVEPISTTGPWKLRRPELAGRHAIPCLACHEIHFKGAPSARPQYSDPKAISASRPQRVPFVSLFVRHERAHREISFLALPRITEDGHAVDMSPDVRQRLCYQCHAPNAMHEAATSDDHTPLGVHRGLSCFACHAAHSLDARRSCASCHPRLSNCGIDVEKMDTTFKSPSSPHNIHTVKCADCHPNGIPIKTGKTGVGPR
jgi:hypothetical protein